MDITNKIENILVSLKELKITAQNDPMRATDDFNMLLTEALSKNSQSSSELGSNSLSVYQDASIPSWVDPDYGYNPERPRKPNMRELTEALAGRSVEELYADTTTDWRDVTRLASELLYGTVGEGLDAAKWTAIMNSTNINDAVRQFHREINGSETKKLQEITEQMPKAQNVTNEKQEKTLENQTDEAPKYSINTHQFSDFLARDLNQDGLSQKYLEQITQLSKRAENLDLNFDELTKS